jgi:hypothetical protein
VMARVTERAVFTQRDVDPLGRGDAAQQVHGGGPCWWHLPPCPPHPTCAEVTGYGDINAGRSAWICGVGCPQASDQGK